MPVISLETTDAGPLVWYKQSHLLLHKDRMYAVDRDNYLGGLMLSIASESNTPIVLTYPRVPFCPLRYVLRVQFPSVTNDNGDNHHDGRTINFYPMHHLPGNPGYIPHIAGRSRDFLTPRVRMVGSWMMDIARERIKNKLLALAMGMHPRLGASSPLFEMGSDLMWSLVIAQIK